MSHMKAVKALAAVDTFLFDLWTKNPKIMLGHGTRVDETGEPYVVVFSKEPIHGVLPIEVNNVPITNEVVDGLPSRPASSARKLDAFICSDCEYEFAIVNLNANSDQEWVREAPCCPKCGEETKKIKCIRLALTETDVHYEITKGMKPR